MKLKNTKTREVVKILENNGFKIVRQSGTHLIMRKEEKTVVIPLHKPIIPIGTLKSIEKQAGLNFRDLLS
ncbi:MAG: type II toxin-antitoxin system HicA family toxin [Nanoarchaeota archaeon]